MFGFMSSAVSSEKPQALQVRQIASRIREVKSDGGRVLWVAGPAVVHTGAAVPMVALVNAGCVDVLFGGNALATHDIESSLFGTSLGVDLAAGRRGRARARAPHPGDQHDPRAKDRSPGRRLRRADQRHHARDGRGRTSRSCWWGRYATTARSRTSTPTSSRVSGRCAPRFRGRASRSWSRRCCTPSRPATCCRPRSRWSRRHQPGDRHQARRPGQRAGDRDGHRHRALPRAARHRTGAGLPRPA